jgi:hypothetical protein
VQIAAACGYLSALQSDIQQPKWIANSKIPVLVGGYVGFPMAYLLGLFTIFRVAKAYKKLELKVCLNMEAGAGALLWLAYSCAKFFNFSCTGELIGYMYLTVVLVQLRSARVSILLWEKRYAELSQVASASSLEPSSLFTSESSAKKSQMGKNVLQDYENIDIGQSTYFTGELFVTHQYEVSLSRSFSTTCSFDDSCI